MSKTYDQYCPVASGLDHIGDRWTLLILRDLAWYGPARFTDLVNANHGLPPALLTDRLNTLVDNGLIERSADKTYRLTESGLGVREVIDAIARFGIGLLQRESLNGARLGYLASRLSSLHADALQESEPVSINFDVGACLFSFEIGPEGVTVSGAVESAPTVRTDLAGLAGLINAELEVEDVEVSGSQSVVADHLRFLQPVTG
ncbi:MAG: helix-turn-helix domain-containing protein [Acidimicrobiia bacterium]|jgi:DNA-binding HxlR family transcriptional regulator